MKILVLNGSPHVRGNTKAMISAFTVGAEKKENHVTVIDVCRKQIAGCKGCEYCHTKGNGQCIQKDDHGVQEHRDHSGHICGSDGSEERRNLCKPRSETERAVLRGAENRSV